MKKNLLLSIIPVILIIGIILGFTMQGAKSEGTCTVIVKDLTTEVYNKKISFKKDDTFYEILNNNFSIKTSDSEFGKFIEEIGTVKQNLAERIYIKILINGEWFGKGIDGVILEDGIIVTFELSKY